MNHEILEWDTNFFGVKVARIVDPNLSPLELSDTLSALKSGQVELVYWPSTNGVDRALVERFGGLLADRKTTFRVDLRALNLEHANTVADVVPYSESTPIQVLEELAIQSGQYSRFAVDANIPDAKFAALYKTWLKNSVLKELADEVLVLHEGHEVAGMVTLGEKDGVGDIGLIAVDRKFRGRRYGEQLVQAAQRWFIENEYEFGQVITQGDNAPACKLYEKCGYSIEQTEHFYHFWL